MNKICTKCNSSKDEKEFSWRSKKNGTRQSICKDCHSKANEKYYQEDKDTYKARARISSKILRSTNQKNLLDYLKDKKCIDCGESDPIVLQFDHQHSKKASVSRLMSNVSWNVILEEIAKCEIRCANCHTRKTAKDFNWYKTIQG